MTLYYTLVFLLLVAEMALFMLLILPLPFTVRRRMFTYVLHWKQSLLAGLPMLTDAYPALSQKAPSSRKCSIG